MRRRGGDDTAGLSLSDPTGSSGVQLYHDCQKASFQTRPGNGSHSRDHLAGQDGDPDTTPKHQEQELNIRDETFRGSATRTMDSSSQAYSGPEDNSTDPHESMTESSTITFVDAYTLEESGGNHSLQGAREVYLKEFVLIDDDEDGDMSLREKTVTELSVMEGKAADLVCGRLLSTSSGSLSEWKDDRPAREGPPPGGADTPRAKKPCCFCTLL
ncbi:uncharacterized protein si:ch211-12e13.12 [Kryptolebias marmoratus]|uniref:uncharacterized protein si:ch211-12e13.12 n=1 Tax=Kryptolebias marmoratus TaxID=37003 RepID=UPI0007F8F16E|nr:uncharacterized protein si:ch211-12e13.12 [Kryptolebias marmoratus]